MITMSIIESILLGLIQGLTEFIPISSSGHLVVAQNFFAGASNHLFLEWINIGTMLALIVYFRKKIAYIFYEIFSKHQYGLARNILLTALPAGLIGYLAADFIEESNFFGSVLVVAIMLAVVGVVMIFLEKLPRASAVKNGEKLSPKRAVFIGILQAIALIPGTSRSGITIIAGRLSGLNPKEAAEYSFLVSIPIMLGVTAKVVLQDTSYFMANIDMLVVGNIVAFASGLFAVGFLMKYLSRHSLAVFGWYRLGLATIIIGTLLL